MARRKLPIGIQTFSEIRSRGYYYVDKTPHIQRLVEEGKHYFLSRPRRFGKSLLLDTLKELFEGNEPLFRELAIGHSWDWSRSHPVLRLSFAGSDFSNMDALPANLGAKLDGIERRMGVRSGYASASQRFAELFQLVHENTGRPVVVLVDEYDKPILDALEVPDVAQANRSLLRGFYGVIKDSDAHIRFSLLTGVSKFSKVSLFSDLNNLIDITLDPRHATLCGYTDADIDTVFAAELDGLDRQAIREWYNGYGWRGEERLYNPFDILLLFRNREFDAWSFETGTPAFLIDKLAERGVPSPSLDGMVSTRELLSAFDIDHIGTEALLFQTGYLTIKEEDHSSGSPLFHLGFPNREVRQSLNRSLLRALAPEPTRQLTQGIRLRELLAANDFKGLEALFQALFSAIPHDWHRKNDIARFEGYYASVFYSHLAATGLDVTVEDSGSQGRADLTVRSNGRIYILEFKVVEQAPEGAAMAQLKARRYADKYRASGEPIHLIAVEFSRETRNLVAFEVEKA